LKTEIVNDRLIVIGGSGMLSAFAAGRIMGSLLSQEGVREKGMVLGGRVSFIVDLPHRRALCPDVSWYVGPRTDSHPDVPPRFAAEVRDMLDYGDEAEHRMAAKRADYFAAGTLIVWDVDVLRESLVRVYGADNPEHPTVYRRGEVAEAEPAVPGWRMPVDELFD
jgi:Uma2 family endonuclease